MAAFSTGESSSSLCRCEEHSDEAISVVGSDKEERGVLNDNRDLTPAAMAEVRGKLT